MMKWGLGDKGEMSEPDERNWGRRGRESVREHRREHLGAVS